MRATARGLDISVAGLALALLVGSMGLARDARANDFDVDLRAGIYTDPDAVALGGGIITHMGSYWYFNPNLEFAMGDVEDLVTVNGDFHYDFARSGGVSFWMGGGPAILFRNRDGGSDDTNLGLNVLAGVGGVRGQVRPFAQVKGIVADEAGIALTGGVRF